MRPPDTYTETHLLETLTLPERYTHGRLLTAGRLAQWLGKPTTTIARWRMRNGFPGPSGLVPTHGARGGRPGPWAPRKGAHGWDYREVLAWLRSTGRLVTMTPTSAPGAPNGGHQEPGPMTATDLHQARV